MKIYRTVIIGLFTVTVVLGLLCLRWFGDLFWRKPDLKDNQWWAFGIREGDVL